ncbi:MAG: 50S ribosomal protein L10 [Clostridia bacterium]|nr:50S ribosomal protein L10 [Clostridia bacterium]
MPSAKILEAKQAQVAELSEKIKAAASGVIVNYQGITVDDDTKLRAELRKAGVEYKVYKNSITGKACEDAGYGDIRPHLEGMTAIAISREDAVAPAKILKAYADKIESFALKAGFVDGQVLDEAGVRALAEIPGKETLVCKIMGCMRSPLFKLAYVLQAVIDKNGEQTPAAE